MNTTDNFGEIVCILLMNIFYKFIMILVEVIFSIQQGECSIGSDSLSHS